MLNDSSCAILACGGVENTASSLTGDAEGDLGNATPDIPSPIGLLDERRKGRTGVSSGVGIEVGATVALVGVLSVLGETCDGVTDGFAPTGVLGVEKGEIRVNVGASTALRRLRSSSAAYAPVIRGTCVSGRGSE